MKLAILTAAALAAIASVTPAHAEFGTRTAACSIAERGHHRVSFKACTIGWGMAFGHASFLVKTPDGRRFQILNRYIEYPNTGWDAPTLWFIDGRPAKLAADDGSCYKNRLILICFDVNSP